MSTDRVSDGCPRLVTAEILHSALDTLMRQQPQRPQQPISLSSRLSHAKDVVGGVLFVCDFAAGHSFKLQVGSSP